MKLIVVTAAIIEQGGRILLTRRQAGVHLEGLWEFPGGKCEAGESLADCMTRELREELAIDAIVGDEVFTTSHDYPDRRVELHFLRCQITGVPVPQLGQEMRWVARSHLRSFDFPPADSELITILERA